MTEQRCGICKWLDVPVDEEGRERRLRQVMIYRCAAPDPVLPPLPDSITNAFTYRTSFGRTRVSPSDGTTCPVWEKKKS